MGGKQVVNEYPLRVYNVVMATTAHPSFSHKVSKSVTFSLSLSHGTPLVFHPHRSIILSLSLSHNPLSFPPHTHTQHPTGTLMAASLTGKHAQQDARSEAINYMNWELPNIL